MIGNEDDPAYSSYVGEDEHMEEVGYQTRYEDANDFVWDKMWERIWTLNQPHVITFSMETATAFEEIDFEDADYKTLAECSDVNSKFYSGLYSFGPCAHTENLIFVSYRLNVHGAKRMWVRLASSDKETVEDFQRRIVTQLKPIKTDENTVKVKFWNWGGHAPDYNVRHLEAPTWDEIKANGDAAIVGVGHCSTCAPAVSTHAITLDTKYGIPSVALHTDKFDKVVKSVTKMAGLPGAPSVYVPQPVMGKTAQELRAYVNGADPITGQPVMQEIVAALTTALSAA